MSSSVEMNEIVSIELPAPAGWLKKFLPKQEGIPKRNEIVFTAPTGEHITTKTQLQQYLKSHPGGPQITDFDWGSGDTPRRSTRIIGKARAAAPAVERKTRTKRSRKASVKHDNDAVTVQAEEIKDADVDAVVDKDVNMAEDVEHVEHPKDVQEASVVEEVQKEADVAEASKNEEGRDIEVHEKVEQKHTETAKEDENASINTGSSKKVEEEVTDNGIKSDEVKP